MTGKAKFTVCSIIKLATIAFDETSSYWSAPKSSKFLGFSLVATRLSDYHWGWSGGAMVLGKLPVLGRPTNLDESRARAYCACSRCGWGLFGHFFSHLSFLFSFSLSLGETARYRLKYCLKGPLSPKTTNQPTDYHWSAFRNHEGSTFTEKVGWLVVLGLTAL